MTTKYSILSLKGESLKALPLAEKIISLDRKNMEPILEAVGLDFPESRRRASLFHPSNQIIIATAAHGVVGYVDYYDDLLDPHDIYLSSIQIEAAHRGGPLFKILASNLLAQLSLRTFGSIKTHIQRSNLRTIAIVEKLGFTIEEDPKRSATLNVSAQREILNSPRLNRLLRTK